MHPLRLITIIAALSLAGCASAPTSADSAKYVPAERVVNPAYLKQTQGTGQVTFHRDALAISHGDKCFARVTVDGKPVADLFDKEKIKIHVSQGQHVFGVKSFGRSYEDCNNLWVLSEVGSRVEVDQEIRFRADTDLTRGGFSISATSF